MKLVRLRLCNFRCFGPDPSAIDLEPITFLLGPNGAGKTAVHHALTRLFGTMGSIRRVRSGDFHVSADEPARPLEEPPMLWIEAQFDFPETRKGKGKHPTIPPLFQHMRLRDAGSVPQVRIRLSAIIDEYGEIEETMVFVLEVDENGEPTKTKPVRKSHRTAIEVHYIPARRDPTDHVSYAASAVLGRLLRSVDWGVKRAEVQELTDQINEALVESEAIGSISDLLREHWTSMHSGQYFSSPHISFDATDLESLFRYLTIGFGPGHDEPAVAFSRLSDGQQSILYVSLVLAAQAIGRGVLDKSLTAFDANKLRPPVFTFIAMEEPENSLSPHYLGRVVKALTAFAEHSDAQVSVATHAPSLLRRVQPKNIRYLRLDGERRTVVKTVVMPDEVDDAYKFVREAVLKFPELYFSRLVVLGEGDSEAIVLSRLLAAKGLGEDDAGICVVPLGGRYVNHFWRLLHGLGIPYLTLLDLDLGRYQGGWGRVRYALTQLLKFPCEDSNHTQKAVDKLPRWNAKEYLPESRDGKRWLSYLESQGVFFSSPLDLDLMMLSQFPEAYVGIEEEDEEDEDDDGDDRPGIEEPDGSVLKAVLGKKRCAIDGYDQKDEWQYFALYHRLFKLGSKPAAHLAALAHLTDGELDSQMPRPLASLLASAREKLEDVPE